MSVNNQRNTEHGGAQAPSETNKEANVPQNPIQKEQPKEGDIRKVDSQSRDAYGDDYEVQQDNEIAENEARTEDENKNTRSGKR